MRTLLLTAVALCAGAAALDAMEHEDKKPARYQDFSARTLRERARRQRSAPRGISPASDPGAASGSQLPSVPFLPRLDARRPEPGTGPSAASDAPAPGPGGQEGPSSPDGALPSPSVAPRRPWARGPASSLSIDPALPTLATTPWRAAGRVSLDSPSDPRLPLETSPSRRLPAPGSGGLRILTGPHPPALCLETSPDRRPRALDRRSGSLAASSRLSLDTSPPRGGHSLGPRVEKGPPGPLERQRAILPRLELPKDAGLATPSPRTPSTLRFRDASDPRSPRFEWRRQERDITPRGFALMEEPLPGPPSATVPLSASESASESTSESASGTAPGSPPWLPPLPSAATAPGPGAGPATFLGEVLKHHRSGQGCLTFTNTYGEPVLFLLQEPEPVGEPPAHVIHQEPLKTETLDPGGLAGIMVEPRRSVVLLASPEATLPRYFKVVTATSNRWITDLVLPPSTGEPKPAPEDAGRPEGPSPEPEPAERQAALAVTLSPVAEGPETLSPVEKD